MFDTDIALSDIKLLQSADNRFHLKHDIAPGSKKILDDCID